MNKQVMIDKIYEVIADKTLSFGCKIRRYHGKNELLCAFSCYENYIYYATSYNNFLKTHEEKTTYDKFEDINIIGHPVMIGDVLDWIEKNLKYVDDFCKCRIDGNVRRVLIAWKEKRKPIEDQEEDVILFIYKLIND